MTNVLTVCPSPSAYVSWWNHRVTDGDIVVIEMKSHSSSRSRRHRRHSPPLDRCCCDVRHFCFPHLETWLQYPTRIHRHSFLKMNVKESFFSRSLKTVLSTYILFKLSGIAGWPPTNIKLEDQMMRSSHNRVDSDSGLLLLQKSCIFILPIEWTKMVIKRE